MKLIKTVFVVATMIQLALVTGAACAAAPTVDEATISGLKWPVPTNVSERDYLGLSAKKAFALQEIQAQIVLVELFSMYCPICQAEAPLVNELFDLIESGADSRGKVKLIGIGTGNTPFEVDVFKKKYGVKFPMVADDTMAVRKALSEEIRTPTFLVLKVGADKRISVAGVHVGKIKDAKTFLKAVLTSHQPK